MNTSQPYSNRTKRRKIAASVSRLVAEMQDVETSQYHRDCFDLSNAVSHTSNSCHSESFNACCTMGCIDIPMACGSDDAGRILFSQNPPSDFNSETVDLAVDDISSDNIHAVGVQLVDTDISDNSECEFLNPHLADSDRDVEFIECSDWTAHAIDDSDDDSDMELRNSGSSLQEKLANWAVTYNLPHNALSDLLHILHPSIPDLPKNARTLLRTERLIETRTVAGGDYYYFGLKYWLQVLFEKFPPVCNVEQLSVHVNIDGIPLFNSSTTCLWPILGSVKEIKGSVFPIAVFCSSHKPDSIDDYLSDFIVEMKALEVSGFTNSADGIVYKIKLCAVICDAPARAFVKCIKTHTSYNCCERCVQQGEWCRKIILPELSAPLRTDASFVGRENADHHVGVSPFTQLSCGMVTHFPLDYMHLICLGVVRRLIHQWLHGSKSCKLSQTIVAAISDRLASVRSYVAKEFSRKPRSLSEYKLWKATELRLFLVYTGPVVLKGLLPPEHYTNFLDLSVAIRILLSPSLLEHYLDYASQLLKYFIQTFCNLYGRDQLVYNVHSLLHLTDDAKQFGVLDNISSFQYESYLGQLKKLVRKPNYPCAQIVRRVLEANHCLINSSEGEKQQFCKPHMEGPVTLSMSHCQQYKQYYGSHCFISTSLGDNCFKIGDKIGLVKNILQGKIGDSIMSYVIFEEFATSESFFTDPLDSKTLSVFFVSKLCGVRKMYPLSDVKDKYVLLPFKHGFVVLPQMHFK